MIDKKTALHTGSYVFRFSEEGREVKLPARYSFLAQLREGRWQIVHHHSSQQPVADSA